MRVVVDKDVCEANGICEAIAPEVFELDENDELHILTPEFSAEQRDAVEQAVFRCPKQALAIEDQPAS